MRLAELRMAKKISQKDLAAQIGYSQNMISQWENGTRDPGTAVLKKLSKYFNVSIDYLLCETEGIPIRSNHFPKIIEKQLINKFKYISDKLTYEYDNSHIYICIDNNTCPNNIEAFLCPDDGMKYSGIVKNDIIILSLQENVKDQELALVIINKTKAAIRRISHFDGGILLESANPDYPDNILPEKDLNSVHIIGKVLEVRKKF